jgi:hypothetical protein
MKIDVWFCALRRGHQCGIAHHVGVTNVGIVLTWDFVHFTGVCIAAGEETTTKCL